MCRGSGQVKCTFCKGTGLIENRCTACSGSGGKHRVQCSYCSVRGTEILGNTCFTCGGSGGYYVYCGACNGSGMTSSFCAECDINNMISCKNCSGTGYVIKTKVVGYYE